MISPFREFEDMLGFGDRNGESLRKALPGVDGNALRLGWDDGCTDLRV